MHSMGNSACVLLCGTAEPSFSSHSSPMGPQSFPDLQGFSLSVRMNKVSQALQIWLPHWNFPDQKVSSKEVSCIKFCHYLA